MAPRPFSAQSQAEQLTSALSVARAGQVSSHNRGLLYGDGVFETIRFRHGELLLWPRHRARLLASCSKLAISLDAGLLDQLIAACLTDAPAADCILKIIVTRAEGGRGYAPIRPAAGTLSPPSPVLLQWHSLPPGLESADGALPAESIDCIHCQHPLSVNPVTSGIKHLNRLDQVLASLELVQASERYPQIREGLMSDPDGNVLEGTRSNIFAVIDGVLCTPELDRAGVAGVMRGFLLDELAGQGIEIQRRAMTGNDLRNASEVFVCNSVFGIWSVSRILRLESDELVCDAQFFSTAMADHARLMLQEAGFR